MARLKGQRIRLWAGSSNPIRLDSRIKGSFSFGSSRANSDNTALSDEVDVFEPGGSVRISEIPYESYYDDAPGQLHSRLAAEARFPVIIYSADNPSRPIWIVDNCASMSPEVRPVRNEMVIESDVLKPMGIQGHRTRYAHMHRLADINLNQANHDGANIDFGAISQEADQRGAAVCYLFPELAGSWQIQFRRSAALQGAANTPVHSLAISAASDKADILRFPVDVGERSRYWSVNITRQAPDPGDRLRGQIWMVRTGEGEKELL